MTPRAEYPSGQFDAFVGADEIVVDFFAGLGTVPLRAVALGRRGRGHELNPIYWEDSVSYGRAHDYKMAVPTLFDAIALEPEAVY